MQRMLLTFKEHLRPQKKNIESHLTYHPLIGFYCNMEKGIHLEASTFNNI